MQIKGLSWLGTRTANFDEMVSFAKNVLDLKVTMEEPGMAFFELANGDQFEVFSAEHDGGGHPAAGVAGRVRGGRRRSRARRAPGRRR